MNFKNGVLKNGPRYALNNNLSKLGNSNRNVLFFQKLGNNRRYGPLYHPKHPA